jgi:hypothetical protein
MATRILITDENSNGYEYNQEFFGIRDAWAQENCSSYAGFDVVDVSDNSLQWDEIAEYRFNEDRDAVLFKLKWGGT